MNNKKDNTTDELKKLIINLQKQQNELIEKMQGLQNMLHQKETEKITVKGLEKILRYPKDYGFNYTGNINVGNLIKRAENDEKTMSNIKKELNNYDYDYKELLNNEYLPDRSQSKEIAKSLGIPWSDFIMAKANTYRIIQESAEEFIKMAYRMIKESAERLKKPYIEPNTIDLLEQISQLELKGDVFSFVSDLFLEKVDGKMVKKRSKEIERILKAREKIYIVEYPKFDSFHKNLLVKTVLEYILPIQNFTVFVRLEMGNTIRYYKFVDYKQEYDESLKSWNCYYVIKNLEERQFANIQEEEFFNIWEKANYELIGFTGTSDFYNVLKNLSEYIFKTIKKRWEIITSDDLGSN